MQTYKIPLECNTVFDMLAYTVEAMKDACLTKDDIEAIKYAITSGVKGIFTAHGKTKEIMFTHEEINNYEKELAQIGITDEKEKKNVIEFFYQLGKIIYNKK